MHVHSAPALAADATSTRCPYAYLEQVGAAAAVLNIYITVQGRCHYSLPAITVCGAGVRDV